jgi:tRNA G10  N-methylase Trm11
MCGAGVLLVEAAREWPDAVYIGCDLNGSQLSCVIENIQKAATFNISLMEGDGTVLPLTDGFIDAVICDLPFGVQHNIPETIGKLYTSFACEMNRVIKMDGILVVLTSVENMDVLLKSFDHNSTFCVTATHPVTLGVLPACIVVLKRNVSCVCVCV